MNVETLWVSTWEKDISFGNTLDWVEGVTVRRSTEFAKCKSPPWKTRAYPSVDNLESEFPAESSKRDL